jgi:hypothetical protein
MTTKNEANLFCVALPKVTKASKVICPVHRYRKTKIDCLRFVMCQLLVPGFQGFFFSFFDAAVNSTNEANKAGGTRH